MTTVQARSLADRIAAATSSCGDVGDVAEAVFSAIAAFIPYDFACLATTDPVTELITGAVKSRELEIGDQEFAAAEYGVPDINQFSEIARRTVPVGALHLDTGGHPERCARLREYMTPRFGFSDELRLACRARGTTWAALAIYRGADEPPFSKRDAELLGGVHQAIAEVVQRVLFTAANPASSESRGAAVLIIDGSQRAPQMSAAARAHIEDLGGWDHGELPANVLAVVALARATGEPARTRVRGRSGRWLVLQALPLDGATTADPAIVVTVDAAAPASVGEMALAARGLTSREQDVARLVLQGASTKAIAGALHLSPHTVQDHLKVIFRKLEVTSRREMIAQLVLTEHQVASA